MIHKYFGRRYYGFSYSNVDKLQIEALCEALNKDCNMTKSMRGI